MPAQCRDTLNISGLMAVGGVATNHAPISPVNRENTGKICISVDFVPNGQPYDTESAALYPGIPYAG